MPFSISNKASQSEISDAVNYLLANFAQVKAVNPNSGQITTSSFGVTGYLYKYLNVKYADSFDGSVNFSDSPTNRLYYGLRNNDSSVESTLYSDYVWTSVTGGFGTTKFFYYATSGGRQIQTTVATTAPAYGWSVDTGAAIDLDLVTFVYQGVNTFSAGTTGFTPSTPTVGDVVLAGTLKIANGGTNGTAVPTAYGVSYGTGTAYAFTSAGTTKQALLANTGSAPTWSTLTTGSSILYGDGSGGFSNVTIGSGVSFAGGTLSATGSGGTVTAVTGSGNIASSGGTTPNITFTGTLPIANGGTNGTATPTAGAVAYGTGTAYNFTAAGTVGQYLQSTGTSAPTWSSISSGVGSAAYYGLLVSTTNQANGGSTTANAVALDASPIISNGISVASSSRITFANAGQYEVIVELAFTNSTGSNPTVQSWLSQNGTNITNSTQDIQFTGGAGNVILLVSSWIVNVNAGDYIQAYWSCSATTVSLAYQAAGSSPTRPASPSASVAVFSLPQIGIGYYGLTSATSTTIGTGSKTFTTNLSVTGTAFAIGARVRLAYTTTPANFMEGVITAYTGTSMTVLVDLTDGSGTYTAWTISIAGNQGTGAVTSVTGTSPVVSSGGTTPAISMAAATTSVNGYLTFTDWTTFNNKVSSQWVTNGSDIYYTTGKVGIGATTPAAALSFSKGDGETNGIVIGHPNWANTYYAGIYGTVTNGGSNTQGILRIGTRVNATDATLTNIVAFRENGNVDLDIGNLVIATSGKGIDFSATPGTGTSELLADYEEGTWTMGISFGGGTTGITYVVNTGRYIKTGKSVTVTGLLLLSSKGSSAGAAALTGLPYAIGAGNDSQSAASIRLANTTFIGQYQAVGSVGGTVVDFGADSELGVAASLTNANFANNSLIQISYTYFVD